MKDEPRILGSLWHYIFLASFLVLGILIYRRVRSRNNYQRVIDEELTLECGIANKEFDYLKSYQRGYFSNNDLKKWKLKHTELFSKIKNRSNRSFLLSVEKIKQIENFRHNYNSGEQIRENYNREFIPFELECYDKFFLTYKA